MAEYIERDKFRNILEAKAEMAMGTPKQVFYNTIAMLDLIPAADVVEVSELTPCDVCAFNPPSCMDGKPCTLCPAQAKMDGERGKEK